MNSLVMSTPHVLLGLLAGGPRHGYELKRAHDLSLPRAKPLAFGQVYATLGRLERDGLVEAIGQDREGGPDRTSFALTDTGRAALVGWLTTVEPPMPHLGSVLVAKVVMALLVADADTALGSLAAQREAHMARLRELTTIKSDPNSTFGDVVAADYAVAHLDADLRWLRTTLDRVAGRDEEAMRP